MAEYEHRSVNGLDYAVPKDPKPRKKAPPFVVVMNENCTSCAGSPACQQECPVDCIHMVYDEGRPARVYVDNDVCIGCMNCLSETYRPKHMLKGDQKANMEGLNKMDLMAKNGVCPWDAIEIHAYAEGVKRSNIFYPQPRQLAGEEAAVG
jgi:ferredoxin